MQRILSSLASRVAHLCWNEDDDIQRIQTLVKQNISNNNSFVLDAFAQAASSDTALLNDTSSALPRPRSKLRTSSKQHVIERTPIGAPKLEPYCGLKTRPSFVFERKSSRSRRCIAKSCNLCDGIFRSAWVVVAVYHPRDKQIDPISWAVWQRWMHFESARFMS